MRHFLVGISSFALLAACSDGQVQVSNPPAGVETAASENGGAEIQTETERLMAFFDAQFQRELAFSPQGQTYLGLIDDVEAYGRWDDASDAAFEAGLDRARADLETLRNDFDFEALTPEAQVSYRFAEFVLENQLDQGAFRDHNYIFTQFFGPHSDMPAMLIGYHRMANADHADAYVRRLQGLGPRLQTLVDQADERAAQGVLPPAFAFPTVINTARGMITGAPYDDSGADSPLWADFNEKLAGLDLDESTAEVLREQARAALVETVAPAYVRLITTMESHAEMAERLEIDGVSRLPRGVAYYEAQVANFTTRDDMTAEMVHNTGLSEVERIHGEMRDIMAQVGFDGTLQEFFAYLRTDEQFYYPNTEEGRQRYLDEATAMIATMRDALPDYFGRLPQAEMEVRAVEPYRIETATGAFYEPGPLDGSAPGAYYVNLSQMDELPVYQMETLAYHEGLPGHHMQVAISQELDDVPMFQRTTWFSAYGEGWALYSENLGKDMGFFTDPYQDFGRLGYEVFRAARMVVDTGIHFYDWSEQEAMDYMLANTPMTEGDIRNEVRRYIVWPGQAISYKVGMLTILELRQRSMEALGDQFDYGDFHDVVLGNGAVPLTLLSDLVDAYIEETLAE
ncbi:DUF885 domain-containing protein [Hyphobacterium indicum]|uniref:DUF885 domain-containing protein n=1 Tax=Hyphobacterium indicum TaxID=2162714 RepID=UPI000D64FD2F|nr:DUF885 domain-containing protein [Hyphobacterium indicum]